MVKGDDEIKYILASYTAVFLKLGSAEPKGSAKGCQGFPETKMSNGAGVLLVVLSLHLAIKIRLATFDTNRSVTDSTRTVRGCFSPEAS